MAYHIFLPLTVVFASQTKAFDYVEFESDNDCGEDELCFCGYCQCNVTEHIIRCSAAENALKGMDVAPRIVPNTVIHMYQTTAGAVTWLNVSSNTSRAIKANADALISPVAEIHTNE
ncbi:unnamed protein product [Enterobius vermicularis]|uniref:DUF4773 domain-containing protein n=1 Tax=Enterobius vermicularis TaxID=51028 RepID=A0A0N4VFY2_ENTVE|nr:unnamed protein product [Enterobius vermicularis]